MNMGATQIGLMNKAQEEQLKANKDISEIQQHEQLRQAMAASVAKDNAEAQMAGARAAQLDEQKRTADAAAKVTQASAGLDKPITDFWSDKSVGAKVGLALAAALGQAGAGIAGHGGANPVTAMINQAMDHDLKTKQMNFQRGLEKKSAAQQDFNNVVHQIGMAPASDAYAAAMKAKLGAEAQMQASQSKNVDIQSGALKFQADQNADADKFKAQSAMKYVQAQKAAPTFALPGNPIPVDAKTAFAAKEKRDEQTTEQQNKLDLAAMKSGGKGGEHQDENRRFIATQMHQAGIPAAKEVLTQATKTAQAAGDEGIGPVARQLWERSPYLYEKYYGPKAAAREQAFQALANVDIHTMSGGAVSKDEMSRMVSKIYGAGDAKSRAQAIDSFSAPIQHAERTILAGGGQSASQEYKQNFAAETPPPVAFTPKE